MLLTITTTSEPSTQLCDLLRIDPDDVRTRRFDFGEALVFAPQHNAARCTVAVMLERAAGRPSPTTTSLATVLSTVFDHVRDGNGGESLRLVAEMPSLTCAGGAIRLRQLFAPLGYEVRVGASRGDNVGAVWLSRTTAVATLLNDLCAFLPRLDLERAKHGAA